MSRDKIRVIPNGIDTNHYQMPSAGDRTQKGDRDVVELLYVGRLDPVKGISYLLSAFNRLQNGKANREYRLTIVGDGTERDQYERQCETAGIDGSVRFEGWQRDVRPYYHNSDMLVLSSLSEGQPTVLMEAQACGLPVVTTDVGGARTLVGAGRVVPTRDSAALATAIEVVSSIDSDGMAVDAREHVTTLFSREQMCTEYLRLYGEVLESQ